MDEVMVGFGRTGELFGFQNYEGVIPDIVTAAKGVTSAALPLSMCAARKHIMEAFEDKPLGWGSTYASHPVAMACAYENIKYLIKEDVIGHVQRLAPVFENAMKTLAENHPSIKQYRAIGMFGCLDAQNPDGSSPQLQHTAVDAAFVAYKKVRLADCCLVSLVACCVSIRILTQTFSLSHYQQAYSANGLIGLLRPPHLHVAPPLIISEEELLDGFDRNDKALYALDEALGF